MTTLTLTEQAAYLAWYELEVAPSTESYPEWPGLLTIAWADAVEATDGSRYVSNPFSAEIRGVAHNSWMTPEEYYEACQDI